MKVQLVFETAFYVRVAAMVLLYTNTSFGPSDLKVSSLFYLVCDTLTFSLNLKQSDQCQKSRMWLYTLTVQEVVSVSLGIT